jgi:hypothetical protein
MLKVLLATAIALAPFAAVAQQTRPSKPVKTTAPGKALPLKRSKAASACAEYGAGFVMIEGTSTCVKLGGAVSIGAGIAGGAR